MRIRVDYTYVSEYNGGDPSHCEHDVPAGVDWEQWVNENYPLHDYGEEGPFNNWNPSVYDLDGNLLYERVDGSLG